MSDKRKREIKIRCTDDELAALQAKCDRPQLAVWMRDTCLGVSARQPRVQPLTVDPALLRQLVGMGNNLNQLARAANGAGIDAISCLRIQAELAAIARELAALRELHTCDR